MNPSQVKLSKAAAKGLGPMGRVRKRKQIALHANLMLATGASAKARILNAAKHRASVLDDAGKGAKS